jgi:hypothetical protein
VTEREAVARRALEEVCSNANPAAAVGVYSRELLDHVNARDYRDHTGIAESLALYQLLFADGDLRIRVVDQIGEGDRVVSRWVAEGHNRGRRLRLVGHHDQPFRRPGDRRGLVRLGQPRRSAPAGPLASATAGPRLVASSA